MKKVLKVILVFMAALCIPAALWCAYNHDETDSPNFLAVYPGKAGTKLDSCALCHKGSDDGKTGSCQYCHATYGYDGSGDIMATLNSYGLAYYNAGQNAAAITAIKNDDSDGDGYTNDVEIQATRYPGNANDDPTKIPAPARVYTRAQLEALPQHTQFMLMNTNKQVDSYDTYTGVPIKDLLDDAGIDLVNATTVYAYSADGFSWTHPLAYNGTQYHVYGNWPDQTYQYPPATYYYDTVADYANGGWCDYSSSGNAGRSNGDSIFVENGLKAILAIKHNGTYLESGYLGTDNKINGEGPFRTILPQIVPGPPDQKSTASNPDKIWPYDRNGYDHNAGACTKSTTILKVAPLPAGTTDIDVMEAGWGYVDGDKIIIYGAIDGTDTNGNGILDTEENADGTTYYQDPSYAYPRHANGSGHVLIHTSSGDLANVQVMVDTDPAIPQDGKPASTEFPYGAFKFNIVGLDAGETVTLTMSFPDAVPSGAHYYKVSSEGTWIDIPFIKSLFNSNVITMTLTDGDPSTDADGTANGTIVDPGLLGVSEGSDGGDDHDGGICFISTAMPCSMNVLSMLAIFGMALVGIFRIRK